MPTEIDSRLFNFGVIYFIRLEGFGICQMVSNICKYHPLEPTEN